MSATFWTGFAVEDVIANYGLGQDLLQGDNEDQNMLAQWAEVFAPNGVWMPPHADHMLASRSNYAE